MIPDTFLGMALTDPATRLPNIPYFCLIQNWEERRACRRKTLVRVLKLHVASGGDAARRSLMWRLCRELRMSDLIASHGRSEFRVLLTSPDAENAEAIAERIGRFTATLNDSHDGADAPLSVQVEVEAPVTSGKERGPCDPCEEHAWTGVARPYLSSRKPDPA